MSAPQPALTSARPVQNPLAAWREIDGVVVIISPEDSVLHELNATASFLWKHADGVRSVEELAILLAREFEVDSGTALEDTRELVTELCAKNLLRAAGPVEVGRG